MTSGALAFPPLRRHNDCADAVTHLNPLLPQFAHPRPQRSHHTNHSPSPKSQKSQFRQLLLLKTQNQKLLPSQPYTNRRHIVQIAIQATPTTIRPLATVPKTVQSTAAAPPALPFPPALPPPALPHYPLSPALTPCSSPLSTIHYPLSTIPCATMPQVFTCIVRKRDLANALACATLPRVSPC